jgi:TonB-linked SusC/RagA family outer membrane protein
MAAIYGSRAAGGVILVTTKRGKGKMKVDIGSTMRINTMGIRTPSANMQEYAKMFLAANAEESTPTWWFADKEVMEKLVQGESGFYPTAHWGTMYIGQGDRYAEMFKPRVSTQNNISVSGATEKTNFRISGAYADNQGNLATAYDGQKQYNMRLNYDYQLTDGISLTTNITYQKDKTSSPSGGLGFDLVSQDPPLFPAKNPYGQWHSNFHNAGNRNAAASTTDGGRDIKANDMIRVDLKTTIKLLEDLQFEGSTSWQSNQYRRDLYKLKVPLYEWDGTPAAGALNNTPSISAESNSTFYQNYTALLRYSRLIGNHRFGIMTGLTAEHNQWKGLYAYREGITDNGVYDLNAVALDKATSDNKGGADQWGLYSYLARINYSFKDKYLLDILGRSDGSSRFATGSKVSNFYNVGLGWVLTSENFIKNLNLPALEYMKLKGSYGETGLQSGIGTFDYYSVINFSSVAMGISPTAQASSSVNNNGLSMNPATTWERVKMMNGGVEMHLFKNRLMGEFNYYKKQNSGMLINVTYPSVLGASAPKSNSGVLDVHGWEVSLNWQDKIGKVSYTIGANMSDSRNELKEYAGAETIAAGLVNNPNSSSGAWKVGYPVNSWFMYQTDGYFKDEADVDAYYSQFTSTNVGELSGYEPASGGNTYQGLRPGDTKKLDYDGNGYISALGNGTTDKGDVKFMGDAAKHYVFGLNFGAKFKGFDFNAFFQGQLEHYVQRADVLAYPFVVIYTNQNVSFLDRTWTADTPNAEFPRMSVNNIRNRWNYQNNDFMLQNNKYVRLKSLIIGYTVPSELTERVKIDRLRVYFSGNDLWELTSLKDGYDPEQGMSSNNSGYPFMRTWAIGLNVSF